MFKSKIGFQDLKIGDLVLTTNNQVGEVIAIKSYAYLNDKFEKKAQKKEKLELSPDELKSFKFDNSRHSGIWYSTVTVAIEDKTASIPTYYVENLDFIEIQKIIKDEKNISFLDKLKKIFKCK